MNKLFVLYDGRAKTLSPDRASIFTTANTEEEAREDGKDEAWHDGIWYEYDITPSRELLNGKCRWDLPPASNK